MFPYVTLNDRFRRMGRDRQVSALEVVGEAAAGLEGVAAYWGLEIRLGVPQPALQRSWKDGRSGDLMLIYQPYFSEHSGEDRGTGPGSPYRYDSDVPLVL